MAYNSVLTSVYVSLNKYYAFESSDRGFRDVEMGFKRRELYEVEAGFERYKKSKGDPSLKLCRTCKKNWLHPALWRDNLTNRRWNLSYMEPSPAPKT